MLTSIAWHITWRRTSPSRFEGGDWAIVEFQDRWELQLRGEFVRRHWHINVLKATADYFIDCWTDPASPYYAMR